MSFFRDSYEGVGAIAAHTDAPRSAPAPTVGAGARKQYPMGPVSMNTGRRPGGVAAPRAGTGRGAGRPVLSTLTPSPGHTHLTTTATPPVNPGLPIVGHFGFYTPPTQAYPTTKIPVTVNATTIVHGAPIAETDAPVVLPELVSDYQVPLVPVPAPKSKLPLLLLGGGVLALLLLSRRRKGRP